MRHYCRSLYATYEDEKSLPDLGAFAPLFMLPCVGMLFFFELL